MANSDLDRHQTGSVPVPDPTKLTTDAVEALKVQLLSLFDTKLNDNRELVNEKFAGRDKALEAAFKSAEATAVKTEQNVIKQIDNLTLLMATQNNANAGQINDIKDRLTTIESRGKGISDSYGWLVAGLGLLVGGGGLIAFFSK